MNNGFSTGEEDSRGNSDQICCLVDDSDRCRRPAGNASYSKRIQKTVAQRRLKLNIDPQVGMALVVARVSIYINIGLTQTKITYV